ncbi:hypothetical protein ACR8AL_14325 [Clavibacter sepedonicus]|nr:MULTISPECIES: hypothetical protein [Clavibacter]MBD5383112.1 hypothetical protein [Clavibacter sp.]UUK67339.1 hypothetical protein LRE50_16400 [Clavibacter sepedonicus]
MSSYHADDITIIAALDDDNDTPWVDVLLATPTDDGIERNTTGTISLSPSEARTHGHDLIAAADDIERCEAAPAASAVTPAAWEFDTIVTRLHLSPNDGAQLHAALADRASQLEQLIRSGWALAGTACGTSEDVTTLIDSLQRFAPVAE